MQERCSSASRVKGYRVGRPGSAPPQEPQKSLSNGKFYNSCVPHSNNKISNPFERLFVDGSKGADKQQRPQQQHGKSGNGFLLFFLLLGPFRAAYKIRFRAKKAFYLSERGGPARVVKRPPEICILWLPGPRIFWYFFVPKKVQKQFIVLAGRGKGGQALARLAPCRNILNKLFPFCVSTVFGETLFEAEHRGLEGPAPGKGSLRKGATFRKQCGSTSRVNGHREGRGGSPLDLFFFFDKF